MLAVLAVPDRTPSVLSDPENPSYRCSQTGAHGGSNVLRATKPGSRNLRVQTPHLVTAKPEFVLPHRRDTLHHAALLNLT